MNQQVGMVALIDIVKVTGFKFSVNISILNKILKNAVKSITGVQFPDFRHCPITVLANQLCQNFKKRKCSKDKFFTIKEEWLSTRHIEVK